MILNKIKKTAICLSVIFAVGCTDDFSNVNTDTTGATKDVLETDYNYIKIHYTPIFNNILVLNPEWKYQVQQGLQGDIWSGYMATGTGFAGGSNNTTYNLIDGWNGFAWSAAYLDVMSNIIKIEQKAKGKFDEFYATALILKVQALHRITDIYGPCIYSQSGSINSVLEYDTQEKVYEQMFQDLTTAVNILTPKSNTDVTGFTGTDLSTYDGNYKGWIKFANSLRLRLAMRIVKVNPNLAKLEAEKAIAHSLGVMTTAADSFVVKSTFKNPIATISNSWKDILMSADMESIMGGYNDPRISKYFKTSTQFPGEFKGVRTGINIVAKGDHENFSAIGPVVDSNNIVWMTAAEVYFLRAEGALRGWNMGAGTAQSLYEDGIKTSFEQHGVSSAATAYIADNVKTAKNYVDPNFPENNSTSVNNVVVAWNGADSNEVKLQKIITQKWIAGFPEGQEAWSEYRRTGYPKLFPVIKNTSGGVIDSNLGVRRVNFVQSEKDNNPGGYATGVAKLGGPDNGATRLWWDKNSPNF